MSRLGLRRLVLSAAITVAVRPVVALVLVAGVWACFSSNGSGAASTVVGTLTAPSITSTTTGAGTVALSWSSVPSPTGSGAVAYYVTRNGAAAGGNCPTSSAPTAATSCSDNGLPAGTYSYTVTAVWRSWSTTSTVASVNVASGALDHFSVVAPASATAGSAFSVTVTAEDAANNTVSGYAGTIHFSSSDGRAVLPANYTFVSGDSGSHTFTSAVTLKTAATQPVGVNDTVQTSVTGSASVDVSAAAASSLSLSAASTSPTAGATDNLMITALDPYGNTATSYSGSKTLTFGGAHAIGSFNPSVTSSSGTAVAFGASTAINFTSGVATVSGSSNGAMTLCKAESTNITVTDGTITNGTGLAVTVGPATASSLSLSAATITPTAGNGDVLTITALDGYGNTATEYSGSKSLTFAGAHSIAAFSPDVTNSSGSAVAFGSTTPITFAAGVATNTTSGANGQAVATFYRAETASVTVSDGTIANSSSPLVVVVGSAAASSFGVPTPAAQTAGTAFNVTLSALDTYGNTATAYTGNQAITFTGPSRSPNNTAPSPMHRHLSASPRHMPVTVLAVLAVTAIGANAMHGPDPAVHRPFVLRVSPTSRTVQAGSTARYGIRIHRLSIHGRVFAGQIKLRIRGLPRFARARIIFRKRSRSRATLTMITSERTPTGRYRLRLRGIGGGFRATIRLTLNVSVPRAVPVRISGSAGGLMPGAPRALDLWLTNSYRAPVSVTGLRVVVRSMRAPRSSALLPCSPGDFFVQQFRGSYPLRLPPSSTRSLDSLGVAPDSQPQIMLVDSSTDQDGCQGATLTLAYTGTALEP